MLMYQCVWRDVTLCLEGKGVDKLNFFETIRGKIIGIVVAVSVISALSIGGYFIHSMYSAMEVQLQNEREMMTEQIKTKLKNETEMAISLIDQIHKKQLAGELTEEQAKKMAADYIRDLRYDGGKVRMGNTVVRYTNDNLRSLPSRQRGW